VGHHALAGGVEAPIIFLAISWVCEKAFGLTFESWPRSGGGGWRWGCHRSRQGSGRIFPARLSWTRLVLLD